MGIDETEYGRAQVNYLRKKTIYCRKFDFAELVVLKKVVLNGLAEHTKRSRTGRRRFLETVSFRNDTKYDITVWTGRSDVQRC